MSTIEINRSKKISEDNFVFDGEGKEYLWTREQNEPLFIVTKSGVSNITIKNFTIDFQNNGRLFICDNKSVKNVLIENVIVKNATGALGFKAEKDDVIQKNITISNCKFYDGHSHNITIGKRNNGISSDIVVKDCYMDGSYGHSLVITGPSNITITGNEIININNVSHLYNHKRFGKDRLPGIVSRLRFVFP